MSVQNAYAEVDWIDSDSVGAPRSVWTPVLGTIEDESRTTDVRSFYESVDFTLVHRKMPTFNAPTTHCVCLLQQAETFDMP